MNLEMNELKTPIGTLRMVANGERLCALGFTDRWPQLERALERRFGTVHLRRQKDPGSAFSRLAAYFEGELSALEEIEVDTCGTAFQERVWRALRQIGAGRTLSYSELARAAGHPRAVRAVGAANGANPVSIVVPCHRVIRSDGELCGYGGGVERKRWLLAHEARSVSGRASTQARERTPGAGGILIGRVHCLS